MFSYTEQEPFNGLPVSIEPGQNVAKQAGAGGQIHSDTERMNTAPSSAKV